MLKGCCCFNLRVGGLIIGWFGMVLTILDLIAVIVKYINHLGNKTEDLQVMSTGLIVSLSIGLFINGFLIYGANKVCL